LSSLFYISIQVIGILLWLRDISLFKDLNIKLKIPVWGWLLAPFLLVNLFYSLFPPIFYDSMLYHLAIPAFYIKNGGFAPWETNFSSNFLLNGEMVYTFLLLGKNILLPKLLMFFTGIGIIQQLYSFARKHLSSSAAIIASLIFYSIPLTGFISSHAKPDLLGMLFMIAAIHLFSYYLQSPHNKKFLLYSAIFWGICIGFKYTFVFFLIGFFLGILFQKGWRLKKKTSVILMVSGLVLICVAPWLIKNFIFMQNPFYPYLNNLFPNHNWSNIQQFSFSAELGKGQGGFLDGLLFPIKIFLKPYRYGMIDVMGGLYLIFCPFILFIKKFRMKKQLLMAPLFSFVLLLLFVKVPRYFLPCLLLLSIPISFGYYQFLQKKSVIKRFYVVFIILLLSINLFQLIELQERYSHGLKYLSITLKNSKGSSSSKYLNALPYYPVIDYINRNLSLNSKVLFLGEERTFYMNKPFLASTHHDKSPIIKILKESQNPVGFKNRLIDLDITHLLFYPPGLETMVKKSTINQIFSERRELLDSYLAQFPIIFQTGHYTLFKIN